MGIHAVVGTGQVGCEGDVYSGLGGGTDGGGGGYGRGGERDRLSQWEDNVENLTLGKEPNGPLADAPGL